MTLCRVGLLAEPLLGAGTGAVHTVFDHTAYLQSDEALFCIGDKSLIAGPLNISLPVDRLRLPAHSSVWRVSNHFLLVDELPLASLRLTTVWRPAIACCQLKRTQQYLSQRMEYDLGEASGVDRLLEKRIAEAGSVLARWLRTASDESPPQSLQNLIGCGPGLTPAGDDFLVGYLVALYQSGRRHQHRKLARAIRSLAVTLTSTISYAHLKAACEGFAIQYIHDFVSAICCNDDPEKRALSEQRLYRYGSSSGRYAAWGVVAALTHADDCRLV